MLNRLFQKLSKISTSKSKLKTFMRDIHGNERELIDLTTIDIDDAPKNPYGKYLSGFEHSGRNVKIILSMFEKGDVISLFHKEKGSIYSQFFPVEEMKNDTQEKE